MRCTLWSSYGGHNVQRLFNQRRCTTLLTAQPLSAKFISLLLLSFIYTVTWNLNHHTPLCKNIENKYPACLEIPQCPNVAVNCPLNPQQKPCTHNPEKSAASHPKKFPQKIEEIFAARHPKNGLLLLAKTSKGDATGLV